MDPERRRGGQKGRDKGRHAGDGRAAVRRAVGDGLMGKGTAGKNSANGKGAASSKGAAGKRPLGEGAELRASQWLPAQWRAETSGGRHGARRRRMWRMRLRRYAQVCLANLAGRSGPVSPELVELMRSIIEPPCPPPGHPERAVPWAPPTPVEQELWADLLGHGRR